MAPDPRRILSARMDPDDLGWTLSPGIVCSICYDDTEGYYCSGGCVGPICQFCYNYTSVCSRCREEDTYGP